MAMTRVQAERILAADLITPEQMRHRAGRICETWLKRRLLLWEDGAVRQLWRLYRDAYADLREAAYRAEDYAGGVTREMREPLVQQWQARLRELGDRAAREAAEAALIAYHAGYYGRAWLLDMVTRPDVRVETPRQQDAMRRVLEQGGEAWDELLYSLLGREWQAGYVLEMDDLLVRLTRALNAGIREGEGMPEIMGRVAEAMGVDIDRRKAGRRVVIGPRGGRKVTYTDPGYRANFNRVQTITRTAVMTASNRGAADIYHANSRLLAGMRHLTAADERVCRTCQALEGHLYALDEWNIPPGNTHPMCRCTVVPELREDYEDVYLDAPPRETFNEWADLSGLGILLGAFLGATV